MTTKLASRPPLPPFSPPILRLAAGPTKDGGNAFLAVESSLHRRKVGMEAGSSTEQLGRYPLLLCPRFAYFFGLSKNFWRIHVAKSLRLSHIVIGASC
jgi:hypothetical protein